MVVSNFNPPLISRTFLQYKRGNDQFGQRHQTDFIENTMVGIEYLWGGPVHLETSEPGTPAPTAENQLVLWDPASKKAEEKTTDSITWKRILYMMENRKLQKREL